MVFVIFNYSKKKKVKAHMEVAKNFFQRMRGLMFRKTVVPLLFVFEKEGKHPIHSFFVSGAFDAVYLDSKRRVQEIRRKVAPNTPLIMPQKDAKFLLELPSWMTARLKIERGDKIGWEECA
ncbi:MAG: DUF192 domain-containing protein [Candidatus Micrarchaeota archaeon]|nr:DUF192 domain-containing protein [Candidatus Micrarchaeota archaeon]